jgi:hypothetical protein
MFRSTVTDTAESDPDKGALVDVIPLSHLELDLAAPVEGWRPFLAAGNIEVLSDDVGRLSISRGDARQLFDECRENEARAREVAARQELQAIEADRRWRSQLPRGLSWLDIPDGVLPAVTMTAFDRAAQPKRRSVLEDSLSRSGTVFHPFPAPDEDAS